MDNTDVYTEWNIQCTIMKWGIDRLCNKRFPFPQLPHPWDWSGSTNKHIHDNRVSTTLQSADQTRHGVPYYFL